jgi:hypothetical protein
MTERTATVREKECAGVVFVLNPVCQIDDLFVASRERVELGEGDGGDKAWL